MRPLDLQAGHAQLLQLPEVPGQRHILQREQRFVRPLAPSVAQPAGLGAQAPGCRCGCRLQRRRSTGRSSTYTERHGRTLRSQWGMGADVADLIPGKLPGQHRRVQPRSAARFTPSRFITLIWVLAWMGRSGAVRRTRSSTPRSCTSTASAPCVGGKTPARRAGQLRVREQRVQGQIDLDAPDVTVFHRLGKLFRGKIFALRRAL